MIAQPDSTARVAWNELAELEVRGADAATLRLRRGGEVALAVDGGKARLPRIDAPDMGKVEWSAGGEPLMTSYIEVVPRHYFDLPELSAYGDGQDDFDALPEDALRSARQAATEVFERNANRSFVRRLGRTKDYGNARLVALWHGDVEELLTPGYRLVCGCQCVCDGCGEPYPRWVEYVYGTGDVPVQVSRAVLELAAYMLRPTNRPLGATGESSDAGYIHFTVAGRDGATDIPEVNAAIEQFGRAVCPVW